jgi:non-ribosomal peptide synthase protein (TIGR01720 family)
MQAEADYWLAEERLWVEPLPMDFKAGGDDSRGASRTVVVSLSSEETRELLQEVPAVYHTRIEDALLTALAEACRDWSGQDRLLVDLEGHGRESVVEGIDLTRTVGWFTSIFPLLLDLTGVDGPGAALRVVKEELRAVPRRGLGYGLLLHGQVAGPAAEELAARPRAEVGFNYLGQLDQVGDGAAEGGISLAAAPESPGPSVDPAAPRPHLLEIDASVAGGRLRVHFAYSPMAHKASTVEGLAAGFLAALRALILHCRAPEAGGFTPSDFPELDLDLEELEGMFDEAEFDI